VSPPSPVSAALTALAAWWARLRAERNLDADAPISLILGGLANLLDRLGDGGVTDYLDVLLASWR
jgi:lipoprotein signal peptidase